MRPNGVIANVKNRLASPKTMTLFHGEVMESWSDGAVRWSNREWLASQEYLRNISKLINFSPI